ncbi:MAG: arginine repressor [Actinomycetota bacterium]
MRSHRRRELLRLLHEGRLSSQKELVDALLELGHQVTQATVSRDLQAVGATKVRVNGSFVYRLADDVPRSTSADLVTRNVAKILDDFAVSIRPANSLVIVTTAPGHASAVARAIDLAELTDVAGTIAGDDTIFVATADPDAAAALAGKWLRETSAQRSHDKEPRT